MHLLMISVAVICAWKIRQSYKHIEGDWYEAWQKTLFLFLFPPLLIFMTVFALVCMGPEGKMGGIQTGWLGYVLALHALVFFAYLCIKLGWQGWQSVQSARNNRLINLAGKKARLLEVDALFAGQIGFWKPELVVSEGLIQSLSPEQLDTVLAHEEGHYYHRDTFWFFWLGWVRTCTDWLPNTEALWQELLMLRELRADARAALRVDPLLLAESLLLVVSSQPISTDICCAALDSTGTDRLEQRIEALLKPPENYSQFKEISWDRFVLAFLPLISILFHT